MTHAPLTITCPGCSTTHDLSRWPPGSVFACACGTKLPIPTGIAGASATLGRRAASLFGLTIFLSCASAFLIVPAPNLAAHTRHERLGEITRRVRALCWSELLLHREGTPWVAAGPEPSEVPGATPARFSGTTGFAALDFAPPQTRVQYEVLVDGTAGVRCVGRYRDGDRVETIAARASRTVEDAP